MKNLPQSLLPAGARKCDSMKNAFEILLDCKCSEIDGAPYKKFCIEHGFDVDKLTLRELFAHASFMKVLEGDVNAMKFVCETVYGKPKEAEAAESPLKALSDDELDELVGEQVREQKLIEGSGE